MHDLFSDILDLSWLDVFHTEVIITFYCSLSVEKNIKSGHACSRVDRVNTVLKIALSKIIFSVLCLTCKKQYFMYICLS